MDYRNNKNKDPWDERVYGTGNTMPPKTHDGIVTLLLILVIFLSGIVSGLSFLNIKLFQELSQQQYQQHTAPVSFSDQDDFPILSTHPTEPQQHFPVQGNVSISINSSPQSVENIPEEGALSWQEIYERSSPSVVSILCTTDSGTNSGSGVIISSRGYIVTNFHLIDGAETITIQFSDSRVLTGVVIGADAMTDLAVLYVDTDNLVSVEFGDSSALRVGDSVAAMGDPLGMELQGSFINGIISAISRDVSFNGHTITLIQTSAALGPGNSGGPLINCYGQVIGINTRNIAASGPEGVPDTMGYAIPSTTVKEIVDQLISQGYVSGRPTLDITTEAISRFDQFYFRIPAGMFVTDLEDPENPLQMLEPGDILISLDGVSVVTQNQLDTIIYAHRVGDTLEAVVFRDGHEITLTLTVMEYKG